MTSDELAVRPLRGREVEGMAGGKPTFAQSGGSSAKGEFSNDWKKVSEGSKALLKGGARLGRDVADGGDQVPAGGGGEEGGEALDVGGTGGGGGDEVGFGDEGVEAGGDVFGGRGDAVE